MDGCGFFALVIEGSLVIAAPDVHLGWHRGRRESSGKRQGGLLSSG